MTFGEYTETEKRIDGIIIDLQKMMRHLASQKSGYAADIEIILDNLRNVRDDMTCNCEECSEESK